jgi:hypothetical protein
VTGKRGEFDVSLSAIFSSTINIAAIIALMVNDDASPKAGLSAKRVHSLAEMLLPSDFTVLRSDALSATSGLAETLRKQFAAPRFVAGLTDFTSVTRGLAETLQKQFAAPHFEAGLIDIKSATRGIAEMFHGFHRSMALFSDVAALMEQADHLTEAGWIPHPALPIKELVRSDTNQQIISERVTAYVDANREQLYSIITKRFSTYTIPQDTLKLCDAVIKAHRLELFPLIVPAVFTEIERCARAALRLTTKHRGKKIIDNFVARINDLPASAFNIVQFPTLILMEEFIYESISFDDEVSFPHRHGSQHGIIRFNSSRDCLNAIFLLDFVLQSCEAIQYPRPDVQSEVNAA